MRLYIGRILTSPVTRQHRGLAYAFRTVWANGSRRGLVAVLFGYGLNVTLWEKNNG